jgi:hypothetical protein
MLGIAGVDITPGVNETLKTLVETIQDSILAAIKQHHESTQQTVNTRVSELNQKTRLAVDAHSSAAFADITYVECMRNLESCQETHANCTEELDKANATAIESCQASDAKRFYRSNESVHEADVPVLECDYALPASECKFDEFKSALAAWADTKIHTELETNRSNYDASQAICDTDKGDLKDKEANCTTTRNNCVQRRLNCTEKEIRRDVSMCTFGDRLQEKCASKTSYDNLTADIRGKGSAYSDPDRRHEWMSAELIKCMLHDHRMGADFDNASMQRCRPLSNYSKDVGVLDLQTQRARDLTSGDNFDCIQTAINFSGTNVVTTPGNPYPTFAFNTPYAPTINLVPGTVPFGMCSTSTDAKLCGSNLANLTSCPAGWQIKPDPSTPCSLSSGCTFVDCCEQL